MFVVLGEIFDTRKASHDISNLRSPSVLEEYFSALGCGIGEQSALSFKRETKAVAETSIYQ